MESVKADACASANQTHIAVRPDAQEPEAGEPAQHGSGLNGAPADPRTPQTQWPPSADGDCRMIPATAKDHHPGHAGGPQDEPELTLGPGAVHCYPDRTNGGHHQGQPKRGNASGSPSAPKSMLRCVADIPPPPELWQMSPANGSSPRNALDEPKSPIGLYSAAGRARQPAVAAIGGGLDRHDPTVSPTPRWVHRFWPNSRDALQHQSLPQDH